MQLWYKQPANAWVEALPVGNGRLGAMLFGGVGRERLQLNDDTLWSGGPRDWNNPKAKAVLPEIRKAVFAGEDRRADELSKQMMGPYTESYEPLGDLALTFEHGDVGPRLPSRCSIWRPVSPRSATSVGDAKYTREVLASHPAQVIAVRLSADEPGRLSLVAALSSRLRSSYRRRGTGPAAPRQAPAHADPSYHDAGGPARLLR